MLGLITLIFARTYPQGICNSVEANNDKNQMVISLDSDNHKYYNTDDIDSVDFLDEKVYIHLNATSVDVYENAQCIWFKKQELPLKSFPLENELVSSYLDNAHYPDNDYSFSVVPEYYKKNVSYRKDQPWDVTIEIQRKEGVYSFFELSLDSLFENIIIKTNDYENGIVSISNLQPRVYYYRIISGDAMKDKGRINVTGRVRMLKINSLINVRDLGGWKSIYGGIVKYGMIIRGSELQGALNTITPEDVSLMRSPFIGVSAELDVRSDIEKQYFNKSESPLGSDIAYYSGSDYEIGSYLNFIRDGEKVKNCFYAIFNTIKESKTIYMHCKVGCDRTGCLSLLLLGLLGVSEEDCTKDYELTSFAADYGVGTGGRRRTYGLGEYNIYYKEMIEEIKKTFPGETFNEKVYNMALHFGILSHDIDSFRSYMIIENY